MARCSLRLIACVLVLCLVASVAAAESTCQRNVPHPRRTSCDGAFRRAALAPAAGGMIRCMDGIRRKIIASYRNSASGSFRRLPRYTGAGETSIHKAIQHVERLFQEGNLKEAFSLMAKLLDDLWTARETKRIDPLMDNGNARYPSELPVDIHLTDIPQFFSYLWSVADAAAPAIPPSREDDELPEWLARPIAEAMLDV